MNTSDIRLKDVHCTYEHGLEEITKITPVYYSYREDNALGLPAGHETIGLIAQEVEQDTLLQIEDPEEVDHRLDVIGGDMAGNWQESNKSSTVTWAIDLTVPTAVLSNLPDGITKETSANITVSDAEGGEELDAYYYSLDEGDSWSYNLVTETIQLTNLTEGAYALYVNAHRAANDMWQDGQDGQNTDNATLYTWSVDLTPPIANFSLSG